MVNSDEKSVEFKGFKISITNPEESGVSGNPNDVVIFIDTPEDFTRQLRIRINDALIYKGNPDDRIEEVHKDYVDGDGLYIVTRKE